MSVKVSAWVWKHANDKERHRGSVKLVLLALADHANDQGVCWPSAASLADKIGESERHVRRIIKDLVEAGDLMVAPGGGRGRTTRYGIAVGLNARQRERLNSVLHNTVSQNTVLENTDKETVTCGDENSDMWGTETVTSGVIAERPNSAPESVKLPQKSDDNHHGTVIEPSSTPNGVGRSAKRARSPAPTEQGELALTPLVVYRQETGAKSPKPAARELIATVTDLGIWREALRQATQRGWNTHNVENLVRHYEEMRTGSHKAKTNGHRPTEQQPIRPPVTRDSSGFEWRTGAARHVNGSADRNGHTVPPLSGADRAARDEGEVEGPGHPLLE